MPSAGPSGKLAPRLVCCEFGSKRAVLSSGNANIFEMATRGITSGCGVLPCARHISSVVTGLGCMTTRYPTTIPLSPNHDLRPDLMPFAFTTPTNPIDHALIRIKVPLFPQRPGDPTLRLGFLNWGRRGNRRGSRLRRWRSSWFGCWCSGWFGSSSWCTRRDRRGRRCGGSGCGGSGFG